MAGPRDRLPRLMVAIRSLLFWSLVYCYCGLCAAVHLLKLLWSIGKGPAQTFRRVAREHPPACLNDPSLGTHCYVRIKDSGLRFHYVAAGERGKRLMLLLHGFPEFWYSWRHQLREFKSEYRVVALDLRGYGETDAPIHQGSYKLDCLITDIKDILDSLGGVTEKEEETERSYICWFTPQMPTRPCKSQEPGSSIRVSHVNGRDTSIWTNFCHFPMHIGRELDRKWNS